jgi:hypothetical protein
VSTGTARVITYAVMDSDDPLVNLATASIRRRRASIDAEAAVLLQSEPGTEQHIALRFLVGNQEAGVVIGVRGLD